MSGIGGIGGPGGPGGIGGPKGVGPSGAADAADSLEATGLESSEAAQGTSGLGQTGATGATGATELRALANEVEAGRLSKDAAIDQIVENTLSPELTAEQRTELRGMIRELVATDPYLLSLLGT